MRTTKSLLRQAIEENRVEKALLKCQYTTTDTNCMTLLEARRALKTCFPVIKYNTKAKFDCMTAIAAIERELEK